MSAYDLAVVLVNDEFRHLDAQGAIGLYGCLRDLEDAGWTFEPPKEEKPQNESS